MAAPALPASGNGGGDGVWDVVVIGGGVIGSAAAAAVAAAGKRVVLLEQFSFLHRRGSSHGESRITRYSYPSRLYTQLMTRAYPLWASSEAEAGMTVYTRTGGIDLLPTSSPVLAQLLDACTAYGVAVERLDAAGVKERFGIHVAEDTVGVYQKDTGVLRATSATAMFQHLTGLRGGKLRDMSKVVSCTKDAGTGLWNVALEDGAVYHTRGVIVAAGPWAGPLLSALFNLRIPTLQVVQCSVMYFQRRRDEASATAPTLPVIIHYGLYPLWTSTVTDATGATTHASQRPSEECFYSCPSNEFPGLVKFALHRGVPTTAEERTFTPHAELTVKPVQEWLASHIPSLDPSHVSAETCLYTMTPDEDFIIDFLPAGGKDVVVAAGFSGHGFKFAPLVGQALAEMVLTGTSTSIPDLAPFSLHRPSLKASMATA